MLTRDARLSNMFGSLDQDIQTRLDRVMDKPSHDTWNDAHGIILRADTVWLTLWQAVLAVDTSFPTSGQVTNMAGDVVEPWPVIPSQILIARALRFAARAHTSV